MRYGEDQWEWSRVCVLKGMRGCGVEAISGCGLEGISGDHWVQSSGKPQMWSGD